MKLTVLDGFVFNPGDLSWDSLREIVDVTIYDRSTPEDVISRSKEADFLLVNKVKLDESHFGQLDKLKAIFLLATGYNNVDVAAARSRGIDVCNAVGYSSPAVAQHVFSMILYLANRIDLHNQSVQKGEWSQSMDWSYKLTPITELRGKVLGIYGYGKIGSAVAQIALGFGMKVIAYRRSDKPPTDSRVQMVDFEELISTSDYLTLHAPLTEENNGIINQEVLSRMKHNAILINTGRGQLIDEMDLAQALKNKTIQGAALDVLSQEPPASDHTLIGLDNCIVTPHIAWIAKESRERLLDIVIDNIKAHMDGKPINLVN